MTWSEERVRRARNAVAKGKAPSERGVTPAPRRSARRPEAHGAGPGAGGGEQAGRTGGAGQRLHAARGRRGGSAHRTRLCKQQGERCAQHGRRHSPGRGETLTSPSQEVSGGGGQWWVREISVLWAQLPCQRKTGPKTKPVDLKCVEGFTAFNGSAPPIRGTPTRTQSPSHTGASALPLPVASLRLHAAPAPRGAGSEQTAKAAPRPASQLGAPVCSPRPTLPPPRHPRPRPHSRPGTQRPPGAPWAPAVCSHCPVSQLSVTVGPPPRPPGPWLQRQRPTGVAPGCPQAVPAHREVTPCRREGAVWAPSSPLVLLAPVLIPAVAGTPSQVLGVTEMDETPPSPQQRPWQARGTAGGR